MAVAAEWDAQDTSKGIEPAVMPLMSLASTAIDQVSQPHNPTDVKSPLVSYVGYERPVTDRV